MRLPVLWMLLAALPGADDTWVVPSQPTPLVLEAPALVTLTPSRNDQLESPSGELLLRDLMPEGSQVVRGQRVIVFDTSRIVAELPIRVHDLTIAEADGRRQILMAEGAIAGLEARRTSVQADLASARAALAALEQNAVAQAALAEARAVQAAQAEATVRRQAAAVVMGAQAGDRSADDAQQATHGIERAIFDRREAEAIAHAASGNAATLRRRKELRQRIDFLRRELGLVESPQGDRADPGAGIERDLGWARDNLERTQSWTREQLQGRRNALQEARRNAADSIPLTWIMATPVTGGEPRRLDVLGQAGGEPAPGWQAERGEVWDPRRGYGWMSPPGDAAVPLEASPAGGRPATADPAATVRVLDGPAVFNWQLPPGRWRIEIGLGDRFDWDGVVIAIDGVGIVYASNRVKADTPDIARAEVTVAGAPVVVRFGDEPGRSLRAPRDGVVQIAAGIGRGSRAGWSRRPLAWISNPAAVRVEARVPAAVQPLFSTGAAADGPLSSLAVRRVEVIPVDGGAPVPASVTEVGLRPVSLRATASGWDDHEAAAQTDGIAREVIVTPDDPRRLAPRASAVLRARIPLPPGVWAVPPHLVGRSRDGAWVRTTFGRKTVTAQALGPAVIVFQGLRAGDGLRPLGLGDASTGDDSAEAPTSRVPAGHLTGRIVAGARLTIPAPATWGRVQELLADGTDVQAGQQIMTLYNPWLEGRAREQADARRRVAEDAAREERERTERAEAAATERRTAREGERTARMALADIVDPPASDRQVTAPLRRERDEAEAAWTANRAQALAPLGGQAVLQARDTAARAALQAQRTRLDATTALLPAWADVAQARTAWLSALDQLALRPGREAVAAGQNRAGLLAAAARRGSGQWEIDVAAEFARLRVITAPQAGRLHWLDGFNEQTRGMTAMARDLSVWGGMPLGEVLDLSVLDVVVEVPEERYDRLRTGQRLLVTLPDRGDARLAATITAIGGLLAPPADRRDSAGLLVADSRVVTVRARLEASATLQPPPAPGLRALVSFTDLGDRP